MGTGCPCPAFQQRGTLLTVTATPPRDMPGTFPRGRTPAAAPAALCRPEGTRTRPQLAPGSPTAAPAQPGDRSRPRRGCWSCWSPPGRGGAKVGAAALPRPRQLPWAVAPGMPSCRPWCLRSLLLPSRCWDRCWQSLAQLRTVPSEPWPGLSTHLRPQWGCGGASHPLPQGLCPSSRAFARGSLLAPECLSKGLGTQGLGGQQGPFLLRRSVPASCQRCPQAARAGALGFTRWRGPWWSLR